MKVFYVNYEEEFIISRDRLLSYINNKEDVKYKHVKFNKINMFEPNKCFTNRKIYYIDDILKNWDIIQLTESEIKSITEYFKHNPDKERAAEIEKLRKIVFKYYIDLNEC